jgi:hypothetical protein
MQFSDLEAGSASLYLTPNISTEECLDNARINLKRGLPEVKRCNPHTHRMSIAGGGPSLSDTKDQLDGYICAVNNSLGYLLDNGIKANACVYVDPFEGIADFVIPRKDIHYYVASIVHPSVFEKLKGCHVIIWHPSGPPGMEEFLKEEADDWLLIGGGSTVGLRSINLGYICGFRSFNIHGLDSSIKDGGNHAYSCNSQEGRATINVNGFETYPDWVEQVKDFSGLLERFSQPDVDKVKFNMYGEGLLQDWYTSNKDKYNFN